MKILTSSQMFSAEQAQVNRGMSFTRLMENAGSACAREIRERFASLEQSRGLVCVLCGKGKNGGDGFVIARKLALAGFNVAVTEAFGEPTAEDSVLMREKAVETGLVPEFFWGEDNARKSIESAAVIVDAVFGTGYKYREDERVSEVFEAVNASSAKVVSIDVPSGLESNTGDVPGRSVRADITIAVSCMKPVHVLKPACVLCGEIITVAIGIDDDVIDGIEDDTLAVLTPPQAKKLFPRRGLMANKGTFGRALSVCGSRNMQGAAVLAASSALRSGAGLVTAAFPDAAYNAIAPKLTEALLLPLPSNESGTFSSGAVPALLEQAEQSSAVLIGCGMGLNLHTKELVSELVRSCTKPMIIDADGINALAANIDILKNIKAPVILTPHPGEMSRLTGMSIADIERDRVNVARRFADEYGVVLLLKGASTVIAGAGRRDAYINVTGNQGMAKGGSGDMLSGIILALLAQGVYPFDAAVLGAYIHGAAGDAAARELSLTSMLASDCIAALPRVTRNLER